MIAPPSSRNDPCPCGSGLRYKHCHGRAGAATEVGALRVLGEACAGDPTRAEACWQQVLALVPGDAEALFHLGNIARARGDLDAAIARFEAAQAGAPSHGGVLNNLGLALEAAGRLADAERVFRQALAAAPNAFEPLANLAQNLYQQKRYAEAVPVFDALIARFDVDQAAIWAHRSICLAQLGRVADAEPGLRKALALAPGTASLARDLGLNCLRLKRHEEAVEWLERSVALTPDDLLTRSMLLGAWLNVARWDRFEATSAALVEAARNLARLPGQSLSAFDLAVICDDPALQQAAARSWIRAQGPRPRERAPAPLRAPGPLRLGFLSSDFYNHPVGRLIVGLLERLDRTRCTAAVYAVEARRDDEIAARIEAAADIYRHAPYLDADAIAATIRGDRIDILFDLNGLTGTQMIGVFALRPAPIQANFLGYTGTLGTTVHDWIIADRYCIPAAEAAHYDERVVCVDPCYLPSDAARRFDATSVRRGEYGLPERGLVFCAFAPIYKVLPAMFARWVSLLARHPGSVLWLRAVAPEVEDRLRRAAQSGGVDGSRIVFAPAEPLPRYLARMRLADLFLDTHPFGAHTTVNDALFAGLPVITIAGRSFAARASASQLVAAGHADLVAADPDGYLELAHALAANPARLAAIAASLRESAARRPPFDLDRYVRAFETALHTAWHDR